jgi:hypothetical protein
MAPVSFRAEGASARLRLISTELIVYLTHIATDKPSTVPGGSMSGVLRARGPFRRRRHSHVEIKGPRAKQFSQVPRVADSIVGFSWDIPANQAGENTPSHLHPKRAAPAERKFDIGLSAPRLKSRLFLSVTVAARRHRHCQPACYRAEGIPAAPRFQSVHASMAKRSGKLELLWMAPATQAPVSSSCSHRSRGRHTGPDYRRRRNR